MAGFYSATQQHNAAAPLAYFLTGASTYGPFDGTATITLHLDPPHVPFQANETSTKADLLKILDTCYRAMWAKQDVEVTWTHTAGEGRVLSVRELGDCK